MCVIWKLLHVKPYKYLGQLELERYSYYEFDVESCEQGCQS